MKQFIKLYRNRKYEFIFHNRYRIIKNIEKYEVLTKEDMKFLKLYKKYGLEEFYNIKRRRGIYDQARHD